MLWPVLSTSSRYVVILLLRWGLTSSQRQIQALETAQQEADQHRDSLASEHEREVQLRKDTERDLKTAKEMLEQQNKSHAESVARLNRQLEAMTVGLSEIERELDVPGADEPGQSASAIVDGIKGLKNDIGKLEAEIQRLQEAAISAEGQDDPVALAQTQHALEISNYASQLRSVESALHAESSRSHALSRQITDLQAELAEARRTRRDSAAMVAPAVSYRLAPTTNTIDEGLAPSVKQKRRAALALLKARLSAAAGAPGTPSVEHVPDHSFRSQLSEDAVFWCPCCDGDLISL